MFEVTYENPRWLLDRIEKRLKEKDLEKKKSKSNDSEYNKKQKPLKNKNNLT